ncbi:thrombospondin type 3 repeat-containing protein, partial [Zobellia laminariae]|uniref:thrombospondin type 3 repeat-containing protein n=1 Tax=Zobellia laminariae TaxID=248906 RepID=UPI003EF7944D
LIVFFWSVFSFSQTNLFENGSLENWSGSPEKPSNWDILTAPSFSKTTDANDGGFAIKIPLTESFGPYKAILETIGTNNIELLANTTYTFSVDYKVTSTATVQGITAYILRDGGIQVKTESQNPPEDGAWHTLTFDFTTSFATEHSVDIELTANGVGAEIILDNLKLLGEATNPDREALIAIYNSTDGANWDTTWDLNDENIDNWHGVTLSSGRVLWLNLRANNLQGPIPNEIGDLTEATRITFDNNKITGNIPESLENLSKLESFRAGGERSFEGFTGSIPEGLVNLPSLTTLDLSTNSLSGEVPVFNSTTLTTISIRNNAFIFEDLQNTLQNSANPSIIIYDNQRKIDTELDIPVNVDAGESVTLSVTETSSANNSYQWQRNNIDIAGANSSTYTINNIATSDADGQIYDCEITNSIATDLTLSRNGIRLIKNDDTDNDGVTNINDDCPNTPTGRTVSSRGCSQSQLDDDNDGVTNNNDNCANTPIGETVDTNGCSSSQSDDDNDGITDNSDNCPNTPTGETVNANGCSESQLDDDNDGVTNNLDNCANTPANTTVDANGCPIVVNNDADDDGVTDDNDQCPNTPTGETVNANGCSQSQLDDDNDGVTNDLDNCANTPANTAVDANGCRIVVNNDADDDGVTDDNDQCPNTPTDETVNANGCSESQLDDDNDGVTNNLDNCANTPANTTVDANGCPVVTNNDADNDGVEDANDNCPNTPTGETVDTNGCTIVNNTGQVNYLQNFSFENWSGSPITPDKWTITNFNNIIRNTEATDGDYSLELDLDNSLQFKTELQNTTPIQLATTTSYAYSFDYKIKRGDNVSAELQVTKDGNSFGIRIAQEYFSFVSDNTWHTVSFQFDTNDVDEEHIFKLLFRSNTTITGIIQVDNMRVLGEALADTDNDGVLDANDLCPNTPTGETVNANGCSESQLDDDNDGVTNDLDNCPDTPANIIADANGCPVVVNNDADNDDVTDANDNCPNTPTGETVNANGCSESQLDDDNDGVTNNLDNCPDTPTNITVDANGCPVDVNNDADDDGVTDDNDQCPNTTTGETVDTNGCTLTSPSEPNIPNESIQVKVSSITCQNSENGEISVSFDEDYLYTVQITASLLDNTFDNISRSTGLVRSDLPADSYNVCVTIPEFPTFERCYTVQVETPEDFKSGKINIDNGKKTGKLVVSGSKNYSLKVNQKEFNYTFGNTGNQELSFKLDDGLNTIVTTTDKECQGKYVENVLLNTVRTFPNPTTDSATITGVENTEKATITIYTFNGKMLKKIEQKINNSSVTVSLANLPIGTYIVRILSDSQDVQTKIVRK